MTRSLILVAALALAACGRDNDRPNPTDSARGDVAPATDTGMAGMDHSKMPGMTADSAAATAGRANPAGAMAGMDHSQMPGMAPAASNTKTTSGNMAGMDHSKMPGMGAMKTTTAANTTKASGGSMAGMDHSNMPGMTAAPAPAPAPAGEVKLEQLIAALLRDSVVQARIRADTALRRRWDQAAQRTLLPNTPE